MIRTLEECCLFKEDAPHRPAREFYSRLVLWFHHRLISEALSAQAAKQRSEALSAHAFDNQLFQVY